MTQRTFLEQLDAVNNEAEVRERLASGNYNSNRASLAQEWLRRKEESRVTAASVKRDAREEETLSISKRATAISEAALSIAKEANRIASEDLEAARSSAASARKQARWAM